MIGEFIFIYILLIGCIVGLVEAFKRNWWPFVVVNTLLLFPIGDRLLTNIGVMLGLIVR